MIAACPKCRTRYRIRPDQLEGDGLRLRCSRCRSVFRVRPPDSRARPAPETPAAPSAQPAPAPSGARPVASATASPGTPAASPEEPRYDRERLVLVAHAEPEACKQLADQLEALGLQVAVAHDGVEAILTIQRTLPRLVILDAALPKMFGFQICELVKRNESLCSIQVVLVGALHKEERYRRRTPGELYGADAYVEPRELRESLPALLQRFGLEPGAAPRPPEPQAAPRVERESAPAPETALAEPGFPSSEDAFAPASQPDPTPPEPELEEAALETDGTSAAPPLELGAQEPGSFPGFEDEPAAAGPSAGEASAPPAEDPLADERARAERLARIIVSDIVLYNEQRFAAAVAEDRVLEAMRDELAEGRSLFDARIDERVRQGRDHLTEEIERVAARRRAG